MGSVRTMYEDQVTSRRPNDGQPAAHAFSAMTAAPARTSPSPTDDRVRTRTGRNPPSSPRRAGARRAPAPIAPSGPGRYPSISTTSVPSAITTPRSSRTRRRPRARLAGWTVAAPGMNAPSRNTGERTRAATSAADHGTSRSPSPWPRRRRHGLVPRAVLGRGRTRRERARLRVPGVDAVGGAERPDLVDGRFHDLAHRPRAVRAVALDERRKLVPPVRDEPAVTPGWAAAADVGFEEHDSGTRLELGRRAARPTSRCSRRRRRRRRPSSCPAAAARPRPGAGQPPPRRRGPREATTTDATPLGRTPPSTVVSRARQEAGVDELVDRDRVRDEPELGHEVDRRLPIRGLDRAETAGLLGRPAPDVDGGVEDGGLRLARRRELGDGSIAASSPISGSRGDLLHRPQRGGDERGDRIAAWPRASSVPAISPLPGSGVIVVDAQDRDVLAGQLELDRLVVGEAGRGIDRALRRRRRPARSRGTRRSRGRRASGRPSEQRLEHDPATSRTGRGCRPCVPSRSAGVRDAGRRLREHDRGNWP